MLKLHLHFIFMIIIFAIAIINAFYIISNENSNLFFQIISIIIIIIIIYLSNFKATFLPFLGDSAFPIGLIPNEMFPPNSNFNLEYDFDYPNGSKVIYWSANPMSDNKDGIYNNPYDAYGDYKNSGVAIINNKKAVLHINCPNKYKIPMGVVLNKHIHYRIAIPNDPILSEVKTIFIKC